MSEPFTVYCALCGAPAFNVGTWLTDNANGLNSFRQWPRVPGDRQAVLAGWQQQQRRVAAVQAVPTTRRAPRRGSAAAKALQRANGMAALLKEDIGPIYDFSVQHGAWLNRVRVLSSSAAEFVSGIGACDDWGCVHVRNRRYCVCPLNFEYEEATGVLVHDVCLSLLDVALSRHSRHDVFEHLSETANSLGYANDRFDYGLAKLRWGREFTFVAGEEWLVQQPSMPKASLLPPNLSFENAGPFLTSSLGMFAALPPALLFHIFSYLDPRSLLACTEASTALHRLCSEDFVWRNLAVSRLGLLSSLLNPASRSDVPPSGQPGAFGRTLATASSTSLSLGGVAVAAGAGSAAAAAAVDSATSSLATPDPVAAAASDATSTRPEPESTAPAPVPRTNGVSSHSAESHTATKPVSDDVKPMDIVQDAPSPSDQPFSLLPAVFPSLVACDDDPVPDSVSDAAAAQRVGDDAMAKETSSQHVNGSAAAPDASTPCAGDSTNDVAASITNANGVAIAATSSSAKKADVAAMPSSSVDAAAPDSAPDPSTASSAPGTTAAVNGIVPAAPRSLVHTLAGWKGYVAAMHTDGPARNLVRIASVIQEIVDSMPPPRKRQNSFIRSARDIFNNDDDAASVASAAVSSPELVDSD